MIWCEWIKWNAKQVTTLVREIKEIIDKSGLKVYSAVSFQEAADLVSKVL